MRHLRLFKSKNLVYIKFTKLADTAAQLHEELCLLENPNYVINMHCIFRKCAGIFAYSLITRNNRSRGS